MQQTGPAPGYVAALCRDVLILQPSRPATAEAGIKSSVIHATTGKASILVEASFEEDQAA